MRNIWAILLIATLFSCSTKKEIPELKIGTSIGDQAPELSFKNPKDSIIPLSSLRGNIVLIDFWASWCRPCRYENRNLINTYQKFQSVTFYNRKNWLGKPKGKQGFKVYNVSLDQNKSAWEAAISMDKLNWPYHVSDLKGWLSEAGALYRVSSIPTNFLIDEEGIIIGANLRGAQLDAFLEKLSKEREAQFKKAEKSEK